MIQTVTDVTDVTDVQLWQCPLDLPAASLHEVVRRAPPRSLDDG